MAWAQYGHGMASVNQTRPHCVNQMGKTHSKPLAARHGRGTTWAQHAVCESTLRGLLAINTYAATHSYGCLILLPVIPSHMLKTKVVVTPE